MSLERKLGLKDGERLLLVVRVSVSTLSVPFLGVSLLLLGPLFLLIPLSRWGTAGYASMGASWCLGIFLGARAYVKWRDTLLAITEKRVVAVRQHGFFDRHVTEFPYSRIQQVGYRVKGLVATLCRFGDLSIESVSGDKPLVMKRVPHPARVQELISERQAGAGASSGVRRDFGGILESVSRLDVRSLGLLKAEVERSLRLAPEEDVDA